MTIKYLYLAGTGVLAGALWGGVYLHLNYEEPRLRVGATPTSAELVKPLETKQKVPVSSESVWKYNLFSPDRGVADSGLVQTVSQEKVSLELIGICQIGEVSGAIILDKSIKRKSRGSDSKPSRYYRLNQKMDNGYIVKDISKNAVRLVRGSDELILDLIFGDPASKNRNNLVASLQHERYQLHDNISEGFLTREQMYSMMHKQIGEREVPEKDRGAKLTQEEVAEVRSEKKHKLEALKKRLVLQRR